MSLTGVSAISDSRQALTQVTASISKEGFAAATDPPSAADRSDEAIEPPEFAGDVVAKPERR